MPGWNNYGGYPPYVSVGERKANAAKAMQTLSKKGVKIAPVVIKGRKIANTFWGEAWCDHIESYQDYSNRLPRGRTYVRNGSVVDLQIESGKITARVQGSELYEIKISIDKLKSKKWEQIKKACSGRIGSLLELIQGKLSTETITTLCHQEDGLFPASKEIELSCSCPDYSSLCKHLAAALYGVGARLDDEPELFFILRGVDKNELLSADFADELTTTGKKPTNELATADVSKIFGIELDTLEETPVPAKARKVAAKKEKYLPPAPKSKIKKTTVKANSIINSPLPKVKSKAKKLKSIRFKNKTSKSKKLVNSN